MVTDVQLENNMLDGYKILFIPDREKLTEGMKHSILRFEKFGGHVIYNDPTWKWHVAAGQQEAIRSFIKKVNETCIPIPVKVTGGPEQMQTDHFINVAQNRLVVTCINDFSWVWTGNIETIKEKDPAAYQQIINKKPPKVCRNVRLLLYDNLAIKPQKVFDAVSGSNLKYNLTEKGLSIEVREFEALAVIVVEY